MVEHASLSLFIGTFLGTQARLLEDANTQLDVTGTQEATKNASFMHQRLGGMCNPDPRLQLSSWKAPCLYLSWTAGLTPPLQSTC